jgi:hypothetical protein
MRENVVLRLLVLALKKVLHVLTGFEGSWDYSRTGLYFSLTQWQMGSVCRKAVIEVRVGGD